MQMTWRVLPRIVRRLKRLSVWEQLCALRQQQLMVEPITSVGLLRAVVLPVMTQCPRRLLLLIHTLLPRLESGPYDLSRIQTARMIGRSRLLSAQRAWAGAWLRLRRFAVAARLQV